MKRCLSIIILTLMVLAMVPTIVMADESKQVLETTSSTPSDGCVFLGIEGTYYTDAQAALDRINEIRYEACTSGNVPDPRDSSRMLTASDYVPIKWSTALEQIARIRAHEAAITLNHIRLNGKSIYNIFCGGITSEAEVLAYNHDKTMVSGVNGWYTEMSDWVNQTSGAATGHYTSMINPNYTYVGLGDFYTYQTYYSNNVAGEFCSSSASLDQTMLDGFTDIIQKVDVKTSYITYSLSNDKIYEDEDTVVELKADALYGSDLSVFGNVTFTSSDSSVATVSGSTIHGVKQGDVTITAYLDGTETASFDITVDCNHSYSSSAITSGVFTGNCTKCGQTITYNVPTKMYIYSGYSYGGNFTIYSSMSVSEGESLYLWPSVTGGDNDRRNVIVESSDSSIISGPSVITDTGTYPIYEYVTKSHGTATLTIYSEYNPSLKRTIKVTVTGDPVAVGGKDATCTETGLTDGSYCSKCGGVITEQEVIPALGHDYQDIEGTYKAPTCTEAGKAADQKCSRCSSTVTGATIKATGHTSVTDAAVSPTCTKTGLTAGSHCSVCGTVITAQKTVAATGHTAVTDAAMSPTCTKTGLTSGSHCSVCGDVIKAQTIIPALNHDYQDIAGTYKAPTCTEDGKAADQKCSRCEDITTGDIIKATGHSYESGVCTLCGDISDGFAQVDDQWGFYKDGKIVSEYKGIVYGTIDGVKGWYYVSGGVYTQASGITQKADKSDNSWYYVLNGKYVKKSGIAQKADGSSKTWYYVLNGKYTKKSGIAQKADGSSKTWYYVLKGKYTKNSGIAQKADGSSSVWYYVLNGRYVSGIKTVCSKADGSTTKLFYVKNSKFTKATGTVTIGGVKYVVTKGVAVKA